MSDRIAVSVVILVVVVETILVVVVVTTVLEMRSRELEVVI